MREHKFDATRSDLPLYADIKKLGFSSFASLTVAVFSTREEAWKAEKELISFYKKLGLQLYNMSEGGRGPTGVKRSEISIAKMSGENHGAVKLTDIQVDEIRKHVDDGILSYLEIAIKYKISRQYVRKLHLRTSRKNRTCVMG